MYKIEPYNTVSEALKQALERESKTLYSYADDTPYNVVFRINSDKNQTTDKTTIFYFLDEGIKAGQLLKYKDKKYLALNQETYENDIYLKSDLYTVNIDIQCIFNGKEHSIPAYAEDVQNTLLTEGNILTVSNGNTKIITEDNDETRQIAVGSVLKCMGRFWQVNNVIYKDSIASIYIRIDSIASTDYKLKIDLKDSYAVNTKTKLNAIAMYKSIPIEASSIIFKISDESIATIDIDNNITFKAIGTVKIEAIWNYPNIIDTTTITVTEPLAYTLDIVADDKYNTTDKPILKVIAKVNGVKDETATITWLSSDTTIATIDSNGTVAFLKDGDVTLTATWIEQSITTSKTIVVSTPTPTTQYTCKITDTSTPPTEYNDSNNIRKIKIGSKGIVDSHFYDATGKEVTLVPKWDLDLKNVPTDKQSKIEMYFLENYPTRCYIKVANDTALLNVELYLTLTDADGLTEAKTIPINIFY